jgi:hypothetical protein
MSTEKTGAAPVTKQALSDYLGRRTKYAISPEPERHWMKPEALARLPKIRNDFDEGRERRHDMRGMTDAGRGSDMVADDRPQPVLKPSPELSAVVDAASYNSRLARERRNASKDLLMDRACLQDLNHKTALLQKFHEANGATQAGHEAAEKEFYVLRRQAQRTQLQSQRHIRKFTRKIS